MAIRGGIAFWATLALAGASAAQVVPGQPGTPPYDEPILVNPGPDSYLIFPPDARIPRFLTENEKRYLADHPRIGTRGLGVTPSGTLHCAAEYEPMQALLVSWTGGSTLTNILAQMGSKITTLGAAELWVVAGSAAVQTSATTALTSAGADMAKVKFFIRTVDSIWIRDYGPRYVFEGDCRAIVDHTYNRPRPNDDVFSQWFGPQRKTAVYDIPLTHGGGNYHLSALGDSYATRLIANENPSLSEAQIIAFWRSYQGVETHLFDGFPTTVDSTQHIDMWTQVYGDRAVMVSTWPVTSGADQIAASNICDASVTYFQSQGYTVNRLPARKVGTTHYTYTNTVVCNDLVLLPSYTNATIVAAGYNTQALNTFKAAWGDDGVSSRKVVQINCEGIVGLAGVMHCIVMHVPKARGLTAPTAYVKSPNGGQVLTPGLQVAITWITDDDQAVTSVDLDLSTDAGATFPTAIQHGAPIYTGFQGSLVWTVPDVYTTRARVRVTARDAQNNSGWDISDANFTIAGTPCPADYNGDGFVDGIDYDLFNNDFENPDPAQQMHADFNGDGFVDGIDYDQFNIRFEAGC